MGILDLFKGFIIGLLVLLLMGAIPVYIISNAVQSNLLQQSFYETQFEKTGLYIKMHSALLDAVVSQFPSQQLSTYGISQTDLKNALSKSITREWVKNETNRNIRNLLWYLNDETKGVNLSISLKPKVDEGLAILVSEKLGVSQSAALGLVSGFTSDIPDPLDVEKFAPGTKAALSDLKNGIGTFKSINSQLFIGIIVLLVIIFLLTLKLNEFAKVIGWPFLVSGIILILSSFFLPNIVKDAIAQTGVTESQSTITMTNIIDFLSPIFNSILMQALILTAIGIILIAFSFVYPMIIKEKK